MMTVKHAFYRIYQAVFAVGIRLMPKKKQTLLTGDGCLYRIPGILMAKHVGKVEIITTAGFVRRKAIEPLLKSLREAEIDSVVFCEVPPDPTTACIEKAAELYRREHCGGILAIGGGSVLDCAKIAAARIVRPKKSVLDMAGLLKIRKRLPLLVAVPTTAGTGSEVTVAAVITDEKTHYKHVIMDFCLVPDYAVLDPVLTESLPPDMTAFTGMDAMTHAVEAYTNCFASAEMRAYAKKAVKLISCNLKKAYEDGSDLKAREKLLLGSYYAGIAFTNAYVGYVHAIAHALGGLYGIAHGKANAVILPVVLEYYGKAAYQRLAELGEAAGIHGSTAEETAKAFIAMIKTMNDDMAIPQKLGIIQQKDVAEIIRRALKEANPTYPVPVIWEEKEFQEVIRRL